MSRKARRAFARSLGKGPFRPAQLGAAAFSAALLILGAGVLLSIAPPLIQQEMLAQRANVAPLFGGLTEQVAKEDAAHGANAKDAGEAEGAFVNADHVGESGFPETQQRVSPPSISLRSNHLRISLRRSKNHPTGKTQAPLIIRSTPRTKRRMQVATPVQATAPPRSPNRTSRPISSTYVNATMPYPPISRTSLRHMRISRRWHTNRRAICALSTYHRRSKYATP